MEGLMKLDDAIITDKAIICVAHSQTAAAARKAFVRACAAARDL